MRLQGRDGGHGPPVAAVVAAVVGAAVVAAVVGGAVVGGCVVGGAVVGGAVVGGAVVGGAVVGGAVVGGAVVGGAVVGGAVVGGAVVGGAVVGGLVVGEPVVGGTVVGGTVPGGGLVPGGAGTPATPVGPEGGLVSEVEMGLMDWISPPTPATIGKPPVGVGGWDEAPEDPGGRVDPLPPLPPDLIRGEEVSGVSLSAAPAMAPPKLVQPGVHGLWSLRPKTSSRPMRATTVAAHARARRRRDGRQLIR